MFLNCTNVLHINDLEPCFAKAKAEPNLNVTKATPEACDSTLIMLSCRTFCGSLPGKNYHRLIGVFHHGLVGCL